MTREVPQGLDCETVNAATLLATSSQPLELKPGEHNPHSSTHGRVREVPSHLTVRLPQKDTHIYRAFLCS